MVRSTTKWVKSSFCASGNCIEVAREQDHIAVRDSKSLEQPALRVSQHAWKGFLDGVKAGEFPR